MTDVVSAHAGGIAFFNNDKASRGATSQISKIPRYQPTAKAVVISPLQNLTSSKIQSQRSDYGRDTNNQLQQWYPQEIQRIGREESNPDRFALVSSNFHSSNGHPLRGSTTPITTIQRGRPVDRYEEGLANHRSCINILLATNSGNDKNSLTTNLTKSTMGQQQKKNRFGWISNRRGTSNGSSRSSENHASTGGATSQTSRSSQQRPLFPDYEIDEDCCDPDYPTGSSWVEGSLSPTQPASSSVAKDLFSPPPVEDRGSVRKRIQKYEQQKRSKHLGRRRAGGIYDGEIEPKGVRGQEAKVPTMSRTRHKSDPSMPSFTNYRNSSLPASSTTLRVISPVLKDATDPADSTQNTPLLLSPTRSNDDKSDSEGENDIDTHKNTQRTALHVVTPSSNPKIQILKTRKTSAAESRNNVNRVSFSEQLTNMDCDISESTCSDDNIQGMMRDFVPTPESIPRTRLSKNVVYSSSALGLGSLLDQTKSFDSDVDDSIFREVLLDTKKQERKPDEAPQSNFCKTGLSKGSRDRLSKPRKDPFDDSSNEAAVKTYDLTGRDNKTYISFLDKSGPMIDKQSSTGTSTTTESSTDSPSQIDALNALAVEHVNACRYDDALQLFTRVLQLHQEIHGINTPHPDTASSYHNLGTVHAKRAQAFENIKLALSSSTSKSHENSTLIKHHDEQQRQARALSLHCFQAAARAARDSLGKNHPNVAVSLVRIGFLLLQAKQYQNARTTFQEATRIRIVHYGADHSLVANLHNNLGVCNMHLGEFQRGFNELEKALQIQRKIIYEKPEAPSKGDQKMSVHMLELSDTLFNIGGLCLEWIRRDGDGKVELSNKSHYNPHDSTSRAEHACNAFEEAYGIRLAAYQQNKNHAAVVQIQRLLEVARSYRKQKQRSESSELLSLVPPRANSPPVPKVDREKANDASKAHPPLNIAMSLPALDDGERKREMNVSNSRDKLRALSKSPILKRFQREVGEIVVADDSRDLSSGNAEDLQMNESRDSSIFRDTDKTSPLVSNIQRFPQPARSGAKDDTTSPVTENDETDGRQLPLIEGGTEGRTRIFISPHIVPKSSPVRLNQIKDGNGSVKNNSFDVAYNSFSMEFDSFVPDFSPEKNVLNKSSSYDAEESCLIRNTGVDSDRGRIHYPITRIDFSSQNSSNIRSFDSWSVTEEHGYGKSNKIDIMVTQPFRDKHSTTVKPVQNESPYQSNTASITGSQLGRETVTFSTGNKERDEIMARARALLETHCSDSDEDDGSSIEDNEHGGPDGIVSQNKANAEMASNSMMQDVLEDGIAPLGDWYIPFNQNRRQRDIKELLNDPMPHLLEIHEQASIQLKNNKVVDAIHLFEVILRCQRRRHGALHPDVAAALHNIGIAQLRVHNHMEALKAFEEAARIRKGCLGKDHPLVAVSLVKVGITLLLLSRFEEAVWSFREALTVRKNSLGPLHPSTARIYNNIGCVYVEFKEFREARLAFEAALETQRNALVRDPTSGPLMFGTATTLCNLGYLYRFREMHDKASSVLKEAAELQENVLGMYHATVLSTLDNLADSCSNSGNGNEALKYYSIVLERFRANSHAERNDRVLRAEAVLHYKMSRVHRLRNDRENQLNSLELALGSLRGDSVDSKHAVIGNAAQPTGSVSSDALERRILSDTRACREVLEKEQLKWI